MVEKAVDAFRVWLSERLDEEVGGKDPKDPKARKGAQSRFGERIGSTQPTVSRWETGKSLPEFQSLVTMSKMMGTPLDVMLGMRAAESTELDALPYFASLPEHVQRKLYEALHRRFGEGRNEELERARTAVAPNSITPPPMPSTTQMSTAVDSEPPPPRSDIERSPRTNPKRKRKDKR